MTVRKIKLGKLFAHELTFSQALDAIASLVAQKKGGFVVTPNVDHVVMAEENERLCEAYAAASLSLLDSQPLLWLSHAMRDPFPDKISGSDLVRPLVARAAREGWRVFLLGAAPGVGAKAAEKLCADNPSLRIAGVVSPGIGFEQKPQELQQTLDCIKDAKPDLVLVALGCPKQEFLMHAWRNETEAVMVGVGASLDFVAGTVRRAPPWMSRAGVEWLYRLASEPRRLAHRYLVRDRAIFGVAWRMLKPSPGRDVSSQRSKL